MKTRFIFLIVLITLLSTRRSSTCEYCNRKFKAEITNGFRSGTLLAQELLAEINNAKPLTSLADDPLSYPAAMQFPEIMARDAKLAMPPTGYVPPDTKADVVFHITLEQGDTYIGNGVLFRGFTTNKKIPGPTLIATEGDVIQFEVENKGNIPHGCSIHAAYTQTSKYLGKIPPGQTFKVKFRATYPGVFMYHCAPGGHAIPMHIIFGQYGMIVIKPKTKKYKMEEIMGKKPDVEVYLLQNEFYASGKDAIEGKPMYTAFNGKLFRYIEEPITVKPGAFIRLYYLNAGPNLLSTLHTVGIIWDYCYWQGNPDCIFKGGQSVTAGPTDSWVIDFRMPPDEGNYLLLNHAVGSTDRGSLGHFKCDRNAKESFTVLSDGPEFTADQKAKAKRIISPFEPGTLDVDPFVEYGPDTKEVTIKIQGNSFYPKRVRVAEGTKIKWVNEDVFSYLEGEYAGIHNSVGTDGPETWSSPLLSHADTFARVFQAKGDYQYVCMPHPYMKGEISVIKRERAPGSIITIGKVNTKFLWALGIGGIILVFVLLIMLRTINILITLKKNNNT